jgi:signal transduction histidine kinase
VRLGIRAQLLLSLGALLALALVPLFLVVERLTQANMRQSWELNARALGRAIGGHVIEARSARSDADLGALLEAQIGSVAAVAIYDPQGKRIKAAGSTSQLPLELTPDRDEVRRVAGTESAGILVIVPGAQGSVATLLFADPQAVRAGPVVRLVALYMGLLGLTLLLLSYLVLTRLVVGPIEKLSRAASKVAEGARELAAPSAGGRELVDLGSSLATMTAKLRAEEEELRRKIDELRRTTDELARAQDTVVRTERLASVGRLAAGLAHEIGNPIAAILSFQELLLDSPNLDAEERDFLVRMKRETERVHRILRDLLDFARPARGGAAAQDANAAGSVSEALEHVVQLLRPQKSLRDVELLTAVEGELPLVAMHPERIEQVLLNLAMNASDVVPKPGGQIAIRAEAVEGSVRIAVEDNGGGIDPSVKGRLFEPFVTTKEVGKGTGLGLAVCRGLIEAAGGSITVEEGAAGARFVIILPEASKDLAVDGER